MTEAEIRQLASEWIGYTKLVDPAHGPKPRIKDDDPVLDPMLRMLDLIRSDWQNTLAVCVEIANQTNDPWVLQNLGAGPLEDLLERGSVVIGLFLKAAKANPTFRQALRSVWECSDRAVWEQFQKVRDHLTA